jgi:hypothetical protein
MEEVFRVEAKTLLDGGRLPQLLKNAGFIDITVKAVKFGIGAWGPGHLL